MEKNEFKCKQCGALLKFEPGTTSQKCPYCSMENPIEQTGEAVQEFDFHEYLKKLAGESETKEVQVVKCASCGAEITLDPKITSDECPFCGTSIVTTKTTSAKLLKPQYLLPFAINAKQAQEAFQKWIKSLWFAPNKLKKYAQSDYGMSGMYLPYWTYDSDTKTYYTGERGEDYYTTETYTTTENGKSVTKTRQVKRTRWYSVSGTVYVKFDDVLVVASESLPLKYVNKLEPWDLPNLLTYDDKYLSGFRSESYQISLEAGFGRAKDIMDGPIRNAIRRDIGGDHQRIHTVSTSYSNITFKHILLPVWINSYRFREKAYRFMVNARTGEVQGERPWSWVKITLAIAGTLAAIGGILYLLGS